MIKKKKMKRWNGYNLKIITVLFFYRHKKERVLNG